MDDNNSLFNLTSFLFGNVDESGLLEDDILDDDCKKYLNALGKLGLQPLLTEIIGEDIIKSEKNDTEYGSPDISRLDIKSPLAKDYFDEGELFSDSSMVDETVKNQVDPLSGIPEETLPTFPVPISVTVSRSLNVASENMEGGAENRKRKLETPLAAMLPEKYADADVREFFPDFRFGKVGLMINYWLLNSINLFI